MASELGELIKLSGHAVDDQAKPLGQLADNMAEADTYLQPVDERVNDLLSQALRLQATAEEIVRMLAAQSISLMEYQSKAAKGSEEMHAAAGMATRLLAGATNPLATEAHKAVNRADTQVQAAVSDSDRLLQQIGEGNSMAGDQMNELLRGVFLKIAELKEKVAETRSSVKVVADGLRAGSQTADGASEKIIRYGNSL